MAARRGLAAVAVSTLALGIGGATAIFSVADAVVLRPLPFADPGRLVLLWQSDTARNQPFVELSYPSFRDWREQSRSFVEMAGMPSTNQGLLWKDPSGEPRTLVGRWVTGRFFSLMGVAPMLGRTFTDEDDRIGAPRVLVLSHALWRERFSADPAIVGRSLTLEGDSYTVVGVMPPSFAYPAGATFWTPLVPAAAPYIEDTGVMWMSAIARLRPGVSAAEAAAEMSGIADRYARTRFKVTGYKAVLTPLADAVFGSSRAALYALLGAVFLVLMIACANVAGLLLVDLLERSSEMAVRQALGASSFALARSVLAESLLLSLCGGGLGVVLAYLLVPALVAFSPADVFRLGEAAVNVRALLFAVTASVMTALLCSLAPVLLLRRLSLKAFLRSGARGVVTGRSRLRSSLVVSEVALAILLLVGAGLLFRSFLVLRAVPLGFEPAGLMSVSAGLTGDAKPEVWRAFTSSLIERVSGLPGVTSAASVTLRPLWGTVGMDWPFTLEGQTKEEASRNPLTNFEAVSSEYFRTMGIAVRRGRVFTAADATGQPGVVVVSESMARRCWPSSDPIGQRLKIPLPPTPYHDTWLTVVGVVADARYREIRGSRLDLYMSFLQADHKPHHLVVRYTGETAVLADAIRRAVRALDPDQPVEEVVTMASVVSSALGGPRFAASLFAAFALVALLLCALGLYGLLSFSVSRRTREIGVRVAVGATPASVRGLVLREGLVLAALGIGLGLAAAAFGSRALSALLFAVQPVDPLTFVLVPVALLLVAGIACLLPASRASRVDPIVALRAE